MSRRESQGPLDYTRHFVLVLSAILALAGALWIWPIFVVSKLGFYGALHAMAIAGALRGRVTFLARFLFVAVASGLSVAVLYGGVYGARILEKAAGTPPFVTTLGLASFAGAVCYGLLIRRLWVPQLSVTAVSCIALGCLASTLIALVALPHSRGLPEIVTVLWWAAFSAGLWMGGHLMRKTGRIDFRPGL